MQFRNRLFFFALTVAALTTLSQPRTRAQAPAPLFDDGGALFGAAAQSPADTEPRVLRSRSVRLFESRLRAAVGDGLAGVASPLFTLNLFDDAMFAAVFERYEIGAQGHETWAGHVAGDALSAVTLTWKDDSIAGSVQTSDALYRLRGTLNAAVVEQLDPSSFGVELEPLRVPPSEIAGAAAPPPGLMRPLAGETVDILVYYTTAAKNLEGGSAQINTLIATGVADANTAYSRSGVNATLRLVGTAEAVGFVESATSLNTDLVNFQSDSAIAVARDNAGADLVALIVSNSTASACGVGYLGPSATFAHSVTARNCIVGAYTFAHEVGHNFGSQHAPEDGASGAWKSYAYGYKSPAGSGQFRTVMAYPPGVRILNFSNPSILHTGLTTGTLTQNNALSLSEAFPIVQGFRSAALLSAPQNVTASASGNTVTVSWTSPATGTATNYLAQVGSSSGGSNIYNGPVGLTTSASGVLPAGTYFIRIYAQNTGGTSPASNEATVTVGAPVAAPGPPQNLTGSASGPLVSVSWNPPVTGGPVSLYLAQAGTSPGGTNIYNGPVGTATTASGNLGPGTYYIRVYAQNAGGTSAASNELTVTVGPSCTVPAPPVLSGSKSGSTVSLNWTTPAGGPVNGYIVQAGSTPGASDFFNGPVGLVNAVSAPVPNGMYYIRVLATAACGNSGPSGEIGLAVP